MKLCRDCKWMRAPGEFARCVAPQNIRPTTVIGTGFEERPEVRWIFCSTHRYGGLLVGLITKACGNGRWFEPIPPPTTEKPHD